MLGPADYNYVAAWSRGQACSSFLAADLRHGWLAYTAEGEEDVGGLVVAASE